jgi:hypothetical protein
VSGDPKIIRLRFRAICSLCGTDLAPRTEARWDKETHAATCLACKPRAPKPLDRGVPGESATRKHQRLHERREQQARDKFGRLSRVYLGITDDPQSTRAWAVGSSGERRLGRYLQTLDDDSAVIVLHDRRIPGTRANIDHIAVTSGGLFAIDTKNYAGKVHRVDRGGWFSTDLRLYVGKRDRTKLVAGMTKQIEALRVAVGEPMIEEFSLPVTGVLCFVDAEWSWFAKPFQVSGVWIEWSDSLGKRLQSPGALAPEHVRLVARRVSQALPPA